MTTRIWSKKETQAAIMALRGAGYPINKTNGIYKTVDLDGDGQPFFTAMIGDNGYLIKYHPDLFGEERN